MVLINIVLFVLEHYFGVQISGWGYQGLLIFAFLFGFGGALVNLQMSRWMAKRAYRIQLIDMDMAYRHPKLKVVYDTVYTISEAEHISLPEIGYYQSSSPNAFATGSTRNRALVAVSTGLLDAMSPDEIRGVIGHEMTHVLNGDMVTMTLLQGVLNTFVIFFARVIAMAINGATRDDGERGLGSLAYYGIVMILDLVLGLLASIILMWFSRKREYAADAGSAGFVGTQHMIAALQRLQSFQAVPEKQDQYAMMKISGGKVWLHLFSSHPSLEKRIAALQGRN